MQVRIAVKEAKEAKVSVLKDGAHYRYAIVDAEDYDDIKEFTWHFDSIQKAAYRELSRDKKGSGNGRVGGKEFLQRRILGCKLGDGKQVKTKDGDRLNCRKSNIYIDAVLRNVAQYNPTKYFPARVKSFLDYMDENHKGSALTNFAAVATIEKWSKKEVRFVIEDKGPGSHVAPSAIREKLQEFFDQEFGYKGSIAVVRRNGGKKPIELAASPETLRTAEVATTATATTLASGVPASEALSFLQRLSGVFGIAVGDSDTALEFCTFGIRQKNEVLHFSFSRKRASSSSSSDNSSSNAG